MTRSHKTPGAHYWFWAALVALAASFLSAPGVAQQRALTEGDRLAMLYSPQLNFTDRGDPIIRVGLLEGDKSVEFTPSEPIRVMPRGDSSSQVVLPADTTYTVEIAEEEPGEYQHWVVVASLQLAQRDNVEEVKEEWSERGYSAESFEVGGVFGVQGNVFDSRTILMAVGGTDDLEKAESLKDELEATYGIEGQIHSEVTEYPSGKLTLTGEGVDVEITHPNVLWVKELAGAEDEIRYRIPGIEKSYGEGTETRTYTGSLIFAPDKQEGLVAMNALGAERLLRGVVPSEIFASAPDQALRAQAVAARSEIFGAVGVRNLADPYMQRSDVYDQVYGGLEAEDARSNRAVADTRGEVMFYDDQVVEAVYSSNAGGFTEDNDKVWDTEPRPYLRGQADAPDEKIPEGFRDGVSEDELSDFLEDDMPAYSKDAPVGSTRYYRWKTSVGVDRVDQWLEENDYEVGRIKEAEVIERGVSGRVVRLELTGTRDKVVIKRELNVRRLFGDLKSGLFVMDYETDQKGHIKRFEFRGAGFGHGVGMCQTGAAGMADDDYSYKEILGHYYSGVDLDELY
ncbi:MAG: SpoIID/LytB domain-containing protein [Persicimonas sp.]